MVINADTLIKAAAVLGALLAIGAVAYKIIKWVQTQDEQTDVIKKMKKEQSIMCEAMLACLDGLKQQGCNGAGTDKRILTTIPNGTTVRCYGYYNVVSGVKWLCVVVTQNGVTYTGYCSSQYLKRA